MYQWVGQNSVHKVNIPSRPVPMSWSSIARIWSWAVILIERLFSARKLITRTWKLWNVSWIWFTTHEFTKQTWRKRKTEDEKAKGEQQWRFQTTKSCIKISRCSVYVYCLSPSLSLSLSIVLFFTITFHNVMYSYSVYRVPPRSELLFLDSAINWSCRSIIYFVTNSSKNLPLVPVVLSIQPLR